MTSCSKCWSSTSPLISSIAIFARSTSQILRAAFFFFFFPSVRCKFSRAACFFRYRQFAGAQWPVYPGCCAPCYWFAQDQPSWRLAGDHEVTATAFPSRISNRLPVSSRPLANTAPPTLHLQRVSAARNASATGLRAKPQHQHRLLRLTLHVTLPSASTALRATSSNWLRLRKMLQPKEMLYRVRQSSHPGPRQMKRTRRHTRPDLSDTCP